MLVSAQITLQRFLRSRERETDGDGQCTFTIGQNNCTTLILTSNGPSESKHQIKNRLNDIEISVFLLI